MRPMRIGLEEQKEGPNGYETVDGDFWERQGCGDAEDENLVSTRSEEGEC